MLSSKAKYALRAAVLLVDSAVDGKWVSAAELAERGAIPGKFLEAILVELRDHGLVESRRGPSGGHRLAGDAAKTSVADVIRIVDGPLALTPCASKTRFAACTDCPDLQTCRLRHLMRRARDAVAGVLEEQSLATLAGPPKSKKPKARNSRPK